MFKFCRNCKWSEYHQGSVFGTDRGWFCKFERKMVMNLRSGYTILNRGLACSDYKPKWWKFWLKWGLWDKNMKKMKRINTKKYLEKVDHYSNGLLSAVQHIEIADGINEIMDYLEKNRVKWGCKRWKIYLFLTWY